MKKILIGIFITINLSLSGRTYYVATNGNDSNPGTIDQPFATWEKLSNVLVAGDLAYIRGGTYRSNKGTDAEAVYRWLDLSGTANDTIKIWAYPGESPILNLDNIKMTSSYCQILYIKNCNYLWIKGLRITGLAQTPNKESIFGMVLDGSSYNIIENCEIDHLGMYGMSFGSGSDYNYVKNCDVHHLADIYSGNGAANGFGRTGGSTANYLIFYGCRAWACSDDGWDFYNSDGYVTIDNCWAFWNGYLDEAKTIAPGGDGSGFKIGPGTNNTRNVTRTITNCLAVENKDYGFNQNIERINATFASHIFNNIAYKNGATGFVFTWGLGGDADVFRNNISYLNGGFPYVGDTGDTQDHNSWNGGVTLSDADFVSVYVSQLAGARKADGSLPDITFMHLVPGSDLIDAGIEIGLAYSGVSPDMGAFETGSVTIATPVPIYVSSAIENNSPSLIELSYNLTLANIVPPASAFTVQVNSVERSVTSVSVSGTKVLLTLSSPVEYGNNVTVSYSEPSSNPLQTPAGGKAASISAQTVSNKVNAVVPPPVVVIPPPVVETPPPVVVTPPPVVVTPPVVVPNTAPMAVVNYVTGTYSGFVGELDASGSYDADKDNLSFTWIIPNNISVSAINSSVIEFLAPIVDAKQTYDFTLTVSDGKTTQTKTIPVEVLPYQPGLETAEVIAVEAGNFQTPYLPYNAIDGNIGTMWSAIGGDQWIILELKGPFNVQHIKLAFQPGQKKESYFDVLGSNDKVNWEPVLTKSRSCAFSGDLQVFDFPDSKAEKEFRYIKLIGQGNSLDNWNYISEFRVFGYRHKNPTDYEELFVKIYPNPAHELVNILIDEPTFDPDFIKIVSLTGKVLYSYKIEPGVRQFQVPVDFRQGVYIVQIGIGEMTMFTQKLIVNR